MWKDKGFSRLVLYAIRETTSFTNTLWDICKSYSTDYQVSDRETGLWNRRDSNETDSSLYHDKKQAPSTFFEEILHELSMKVSSITEKIENSKSVYDDSWIVEMMLSIRSIDLKNEKEAMNKYEDELNE